MIFTSKKEFYTAMHKLNTNKPWSVIASLRLLSDVLYDEAKKVGKLKTVSFQKKAIRLIEFILVISLITIVLSIVGFGATTTPIGGMGIMLSLIYFIFLGGWEPDYSNEVYYRHRELIKNILTQYEAYHTEVNQKVRDIHQQWQLINKTSEIHEIKSILKGGAATHPIDYMTDDSLLKYWNEVEKPRLLSDKDKEVNQQIAISDQLEKEIEFCKSIK